MPFVVREVDVARELPVMQAALNANRNRITTLERFEWLYLHNPDGPARAWFVSDSDSGATAGFTAVFPRRVMLRGSTTPVVAWNCGDFSIHQRYRTGGAAVKLRRAAREAVDRGESPFLYAHPNDRMLPVHLRVGHLALAKMVRYAKPLRLTGLPLVGGVTAAALRLTGRDWMVRRSDEVHSVDAVPEAEVDEMYARIAPTLGTSLVRDAKYLEWRFLQCPNATELLVARRAGRVTAFVAWSRQGEHAHIKDWLAQDVHAWQSIFSRFLRIARARRLRSVSVIALETNPDLPRFRQFGFIPRPDTSTAVSYAPEGSALRSDVTEPKAWFMTVGDRDV